MSRVRRPGVWFGAGVAIALVIGAIALASFTRSDWGRGRILGYTLSILGGRLNGQLVVERLEGDLFTGARLYGIAVREAAGTPLLVADSAYIDYKLATFLGGDIIINRLVLYDAELALRRLPGDSLWNYQELLLDTTRTPGQGPGRATRIESLEVVNGTASVRLPWEPEPRIRGAERARVIRAALADTSRLVVDSVAGGYLRTMRFELDTAVVAQLTIAPDERGGTSLAIEGARGRAYLWSKPALRIADLRGVLTLQDGVVRYSAPTIALSGSRMESAGLIDMTEAEPRYDLAVAGTEVDLADLQWLLPSLPDRGSVTMRLALETRPEGLLYLFRGIQMQATGTRLVGDFGMVMGDTLRFVDADLRAEPLNLRTIRDLLPPTVPVEELRIGAMVVESPAS